MGSIQIRLLHPIKFISLNWNLQNLVKLYDPLQYAKDEWMYMSYPYPFNSLSINSIIFNEITYTIINPLHIATDRIV